jgi:HAMP domain-containing protein
MRWFNNLSIRVKVLSISLLSLLGFLLYLGINYYATRDVAGHLQSIQHSDVPALQAINTYSVQLGSLRDSYAKAMADRDSVALAKAESTAAALQEGLSQNLSDASKDDQIRLLDRFREYNLSADSLARDMVAGRLSSDQAVQRLQLLEQLQRDFDTQMESYKDGVYQGFATKIGDVRKRNDDVWMLGLMLGTVLAIGVLGLTLWITNRMIIQPLTHAVDASNKIAEGDWSISIVTAARDELGNLLHSIQKMRDRLKSRFDEDRREERIKTSVAELANVMRGELSMDLLAERILNYLVPALRGQVGLFYLLEGKDMVLKGTYAFTWRKNLSSRIPVGEGLVGQAALEKKQIVLTRIPEDYIVVSSGLGETTPRHIVVTPILHEGELCGMLEIGALDALGPEELEILTLSVEHIAIAVNSATIAHEALRDAAANTKASRTAETPTG